MFNHMIILELLYLNLPINTLIIYHHMFQRKSKFQMYYFHVFFFTSQLNLKIKLFHLVIKRNNDFRYVIKSIK